MDELERTVRAVVRAHWPETVAYGRKDMEDAVMEAVRDAALPGDEPGAWLSRELLLRAVDLRAVAWNALCAVPAGGGSWERFWRKLHELRESVNRPEHEDIRLAYAGTFPEPNPAAKREEHPRILDERWRIVDPEPDAAESPEAPR